MVQVRDAGNLLSGAQFSLQTVDTDEVTLRYNDVGEAVAHLRVRLLRPVCRIQAPWCVSTHLTAAAADLPA